LTVRGRSITYSAMQFELASVLVFLALGAGFILAVITVGGLLRPRVQHAVKLETYECGEHPIAQAWFNFNPRFYVIALIFLIFDVEVAFTYPVGVTFRRWVEEGKGATAFLEILLFVAILALGLAYVWRKGDLEWIRPVIKQDPALPEPPVEP
jgi:NADH-quinone oxidoreductase subunit A